MAELKLERVFAASPETVFAYVTKTEHLLKWWGHEGFELIEHNLNFSEPGPWASVLANAEGQRYKMTGSVTSINPPNSVEFTWGWHDENDQRGHESSVRFELKPNDVGGTIFTLLHTNLPDEDTANSHADGWASALRNLKKLPI